MRYLKVIIFILVVFSIIGFYTTLYIIYKPELIRRRMNSMKVSLRKFDDIGDQPVPQNCRKHNEADTYQVCKELPYFFTTCGNNSTESNKEYLIPNIVNFVWVGNRVMRFYDYLTIRSAAFIQKADAINFYYSETKPQGDLWERVEKEISCLKTIKFVALTTLFGKKIIGIVHQTDIERMAILLKHGGIYLDFDAIIVKPLEPLRKYEFVMGRSAPHLLSSGVILSKPSSTFLRTWRSYYNLYQERSFYTSFLLRLHQWRPDLPIHIEDESLQRPNPWSDSINCMSNESFDISKNYIVHLHPTRGLKGSFKDFREEQLRLEDSTYGSVARIVLFGTSDLIYLTNDTQKRRNRTIPKELKHYHSIDEYGLPQKLPEGKLGMNP